MSKQRDWLDLEHSEMKTEVARLVDNLENRIAELRRKLREVEVRMDQLADQQAELTEELDEVMSIRKAILNGFPSLKRQAPPDLRELDSSLAGLPLGEAMETILRSARRSMHQDELVQILEMAGFPLGDLAGRRLHAAQLGNDKIAKMDSKVYLYVGPTEAEQPLFMHVENGPHLQGAPV